jgi:hypothetical protein
MLRRSLLVLLVLGSATPLLAQQEATASRARGTQSSSAAWRVVVRDTLGFAVPYAVVDANPGGRRVADDHGVVIYTRPRADSVRVIVRRIGFLIADGWLRSDREGLVALTPVARSLAAMNVTERQNTQLAQRGFYDRMERVQRGAIVGEFMTPEDLDRISPMLLSRALRESKYVKIARPPGGGVSGTAFLGRADCGFTVLVDGQRVASLQDEMPGLTSINARGSSRAEFFGRLRPPSLEELVAGSEIAAIEVYPSAANAPAELQARAMAGRGSCGIIAIWTGDRR